MGMWWTGTVTEQRHRAMPPAVEAAGGVAVLPWNCHAVKPCLELRSSSIRKRCSDLRSYSEFLSSTGSVSVCIICPSLVRVNRRPSKRLSIIMFLDPPISKYFAFKAWLLATL